VLADLITRGLRTPEFLITDGAAGLEQAFGGAVARVPAQPMTNGAVEQEKRAA